MPERPAIILDCDPGHDDAIAILLAGRHTDLLGITAVSGNAPLARTTANALIVCQVLGLDVPVYGGADGPLAVDAFHAPEYHGETGLGGPELPPLERTLAGDDAVGFIVDSVRARPGTWLVATGPLTNVALALRAAPDLVDLVAGVSIMGGSSTFGNITPTSEFNIWCDPHAAAEVFDSGVTVTMSGLNLTHQVLMTSTHIERIRTIGTPVATFVADLMDFFTDAYSFAFNGTKQAPIHDACAVAALTHPEAFVFVDEHVQVETGDGVTRGMTVVDRRATPQVAPPNCRVGESVDAEAMFGLIEDAIRAYH